MKIDLHEDGHRYEGVYRVSTNVDYGIQLGDVAKARIECWSAEHVEHVTEPVAKEAPMTTPIISEREPLPNCAVEEFLAQHNARQEESMVMAEPDIRPLAPRKRPLPQRQALAVDDRPRAMQALASMRWTMLSGSSADSARNHTSDVDSPSDAMSLYQWHRIATPMGTKKGASTRDARTQAIR